jgi:DNA-binding CsgD family transcriptional regulator
MATPPQADTALQPSAGSLPGREREQATLAVRLTAALAGEGSLVLVGGEAGIGKTTLVSWLATEARQRGSQVLTGYCHDLTQTPPYGPWREAFARVRLAADRAGDPPHLPWGDDLAAVTSQSLLFDQIREYLVRETAPGPLTVVLEDMHWSDPASLELLLHIVRGIDSLPLLLIATYRDDEITPREPLFALLPLLARAPHVERIDLGALSADALQALVTRRFALAEDDRARLVAFLQVRSGGNAFYVMELLRALEAERLLRPAGDGWLLGELERAPVPRLIRQIIEGRLAKIDGGVLELLEIAAVIGQDVPLDVWEAAGEANRDRLAMAMEHALEARLIFEPSDTTTFRFTHALVRETLYHRQTLVERQMRHRRVAEILASRPDPPLSVVAAHFAYGDDARAIDWLVRSGEQALALYAARDSITALTRAHDLAGRFGQPLPPAAYRARAAAATLIGEFDDARRDHELALDRGRASGDRQAEWQALLDLGMLWAERDYERTIGYYRAALALAREFGDKPMIAYSLNRVGNWHVNLDEPDVAVPLHEEALALFTASDDRAGIADTLDFLGLATYLNAEFPLSTRYCERAIPLFRELGDRQRLSSCLTVLAVTGGDLTWATAPLYREPGYWIRSGEEGLRLAREIGWLAGEAFALMCLAMATVSHGDLGRAIRDAQASLAIAERIDHRQWILAARQTLAMVWIELIEPQRAITELEWALASARISGSRFWTNAIVAILASLRVSVGDLHQAAAVLGTVVESGKPQLQLSHRQCRFARAELSLAQGDPDRALVITDELANAGAHSSPERDVPQLMKLRGDALFRLGRGTEAEQAYLAARNSAKILGFQPLLWRIDGALGALYLRHGRTPEAEEALRNARATIDDVAVTIEDALLREQFRSRALAHLPAEPRLTQGPISATRLSARELEVLRLIVEGKSDREIAAALFISPRTVMRHVTGILDKLGVGSRTAAAATAIRQGIV